MLKKVEKYFRIAKMFGIQIKKKKKTLRHKIFRTKNLQSFSNNEIIRIRNVQYKKEKRIFRTKNFRNIQKLKNRKF